MRPFIYILLCLLFFSTELFSQNPHWTRSYDLQEDFPPNNDQGMNIEKFQGDYVIVSLSLFESNTVLTIGLLRIDSEGEVLLKKWYQDSQHPLRTFGSLQMLTDEDNLVIAGDRYLGSGLGYEYFLMKLDENLDTLWMKTYAGEYMYYPRSLVKSKFGGYLIHGDGPAYDCDYCFDITLVRTDEDGNELWRKTLGLQDQYVQSTFGNMVELDNGDLAVICNGVLPGGVDTYAHLVMLDSVGNTKWSKRVYKMVNLGGNRMAKSPDGNLVFATPVDTAVAPWTTNPWVVFLTKVDTAGNVLWSTHFDSAPTLKEVSKIIFTEEGDVLVAGFYSSPPWQKAWIAKVSSGGELLWEKYYGVADNIFDGGGTYFGFFDIEHAYDEGLVVSGVIQDTVEGGFIDGNIWVMTLDENGCFDEADCPQDGLIIVSSDELTAWAEELSYYPNPTSRQVYLEVPAAVSGRLDVQILDVRGRLLSEQKGLDSGDVLQFEGPGVYYLAFYYQGIPVHTGKVVVF